MDTTIDQQVAMDEALVPRFPGHCGRAKDLYAGILGNNHYPSSRHPIQDGQQEAVNLESFRDMLHICPRVHGQTFDEPPFEKEILAFIRFLGHSELNTYKEYYAVVTRKAAPKPKASVRRTRSGSDTSITPPTAATSPKLTASAKGKQTAKASKAKSQSALSEIAMTEAQQLKLVTKRSRQQMHISQASGSSVDEGTEDIGLNLGEEEEHVEEKEEDELYRDVNINQRRGLQATLKVEDTHVTLTLVKPDGQQESSLVSPQFVTSMLNLTLDAGMESIFETTSRIDA
nr:hypothetical protein [Tanacetum cinerariifolium]